MLRVGGCLGCVILWCCRAGCGIGLFTRSCIIGDLNYYMNYLNLCYYMPQIGSSMNSLFAQYLASSNKLARICWFGNKLTFDMRVHNSILADYEPFWYFKSKKYWKTYHKQQIFYTFLHAKWLWPNFAYIGKDSIDSSIWTV